MPKIIVWSGQHSEAIKNLIQEVYQSKDTLLILCPPRITDISEWLPKLPSGRVEFAGEMKQEAFDHHSDVVYPAAPKFGLFSTGTENGTKLILYTNQNFEASIKGIFSYFKDLKINSIFSYPQPYHIFGLSLGYIASLVLNKKLIIPSGAYSGSAHQLWNETTKREGLNLLTLGTPTHFLDALKFCHDQNLPIHQSLTSIAGGAKVEKQLWHLMQSDLNILKPSIGYGCSEASPGVTHLTPGRVPYSDNDLGTVIPGGELISVEDKFLYHGANVCLAIIQKGQIEFPHGRYLLSDSLRVDEEGFYFYQNRATLVLNRGGEKFSLEEIESVVKKVRGTPSVALAIPDQRLGFELGLLYEGESDIKELILETLSEVFKRNFNPELIIPVSHLPINANAKYDRSMSQQILLQRSQMKHTSELSDYLPHRDNMVWIDYVLEADTTGGSCLVKIDPAKHYYSDEGVRQSAFIEWMAQGYGFVNAHFAKEQGMNQTLEKAFLVGVDKMTFQGKMPTSGEEIIVSVKTIRNVGPISYVEGKIYSQGTQASYCEAVIKLFSA